MTGLLLVKLATGAAALQSAAGASLRSNDGEQDGETGEKNPMRKS